MCIVEQIYNLPVLAFWLAFLAANANIFAFNDNIHVLSVPVNITMSKNNC